MDGNECQWAQLLTLPQVSAEKFAEDYADICRFETEMARFVEVGHE